MTEDQVAVEIYRDWCAERGICVAMTQDGSEWIFVEVLMGRPPSRVERKTPRFLGRGVFLFADSRRLNATAHAHFRIRSNAPRH